MDYHIKKIGSKVESALQKLGEMYINVGEKIIQETNIRLPTSNPILFQTIIATKKAIDKVEALNTKEKLTLGEYLTKATQTFRKNQNGFSKEHRANETQQRERE